MQALSEAEGSINSQVRQGVEEFNKDNILEAYNLLIEPAKADDAEAQFILGRILLEKNYSGHGGSYWWSNVDEWSKIKKFDKRNDKMRETGINWMRKSLWQDYVPALLYMGNLYTSYSETQPHKTEGVQWLQRAAKRNSAEACYQLGNCARFGYGMDKDDKAALGYYEKAAAFGHAESAFMLYEFYSPDHYPSIPTDEVKSMQFFDIAVMLQWPKAMELMGTFYMEGTNGRPQNIDRAIEWYDKAGTATANVNARELREKKAQEALQKELDRMTPLQAYKKGFSFYENKEYKEAWPYLMHAAERGNMDAEFVVGYMYNNGEHVSKNLAEGFNWYKKAADKGHPKAMVNIGYKYERGEGVSADENEALAWYKKAAAKGNQTGKDNYDKLTAAISKRKQEESQRKAEAQKQAQAQAQRPAQNSGDGNGAKQWRVNLPGGGYSDYNMKEDGTMVVKTVNTCIICHGDGVCKVCYGQGATYNRALNSYFPCSGCLQSGRCKYCKGQGRQEIVTVSDGAGGAWAMGSDGSIAHSSQASHSSSSSSYSSSSSSGRSSSSSGVCDRCGGLGLDKNGLYYDDPGGAVSHTYGHVAYTHTDNTKCQYCGRYVYHVHLKCTKCGYR